MIPVIVNALKTRVKILNEKVVAPSHPILVSEHKNTVKVRR